MIKEFSYKKVAVLLPTYKGIKFLDRQIKSIIFQKRVKVDLYISVEPTVDGSREYLHALQKKFRNIIVLYHNVNFGSPTKNFFFLINNINEKKYDYISLSDHDDIWFNDKIEKSIQKITFYKVDCYSSSVIAFNDKKKFLLKKKNKQKKYDFYFESAGPGSTFCFKSKFITSLKKFIYQKKNASNFLYYDWLIYAYARRNKFKWYIDEKPTLFYRQHSNNYTGARWNISSHFKRFIYVVNGNAIRNALELDNLINYRSFLLLNNFINRLRLIFLSFQFRRSIFDAFLLFLYFIIANFFFRFKKKTLIFSISKTVNIFLILSVFFFLNNLFNPKKEVVLFYNLNFITHLKMIILFMISNVIISYRYLRIFKISSAIKINFVNWLYFFNKSYVSGLIIPYSNFITRAAFLKQKINLQYKNFFFSTIFILFIEYVWIILVFLYFYVTKYESNIIFKIILLIIFFSILSKFLYLNIIKIYNYIGNKLSILKEDIILSEIKPSDIAVINISTLSKIIINIVIIYNITFFFNLNLNLEQILFFSIFNFIIDSIKIFPYNFGFQELLLGYLFFFNDLGFINGVLFKLYYRYFEFLALIFFILLYSIVKKTFLTKKIK